MTGWTPDPRPLFQRVVDDIKAKILRGELRPGERITGTRQLAGFYGVSTMTAQRALHDLQTIGATYGVVGKGTFVRLDAVSRLTTSASSADCNRCEDEASYTAHLVAVIGRCHQLADRLATLRSPSSAAAEIRRVASMLAGGLMDHALYLDRSGSRHWHDEHDDE